MNEYRKKHVKGYREIAKENIDCWDWSDIVMDDKKDLDQSSNLKAEGVGHLVPSPTPKIECNYSCHLEITYKHPHTVGWLKMTSQGQKAKMAKIWNEIKCIFGEPIDRGYVFEYHENGQIHLHGYLCLKFDGTYSPPGLLSDYVKMYLAQMPKKYNTINLNYLYTEFIRYASPQIAVQYFDAQEKYEWKNKITGNDMKGTGQDRLKYWIQYLLKQNGEILKK